MDQSIREKLLQRLREISYQKSNPISQKQATDFLQKAFAGVAPFSQCGPSQNDLIPIFESHVLECMNYLKARNMVSGGSPSPDASSGGYFFYCKEVEEVAFLRLEMERDRQLIKSQIESSTRDLSLVSNYSNNLPQMQTPLKPQVRLVSNAVLPSPQLATPNPPILAQQSFPNQYYNTSAQSPTLSQYRQGSAGLVPAHSPGSNPATPNPFYNSSPLSNSQMKAETHAISPSLSSSQIGSIKQNPYPAQQVSNLKMPFVQPSQNNPQPSQSVLLPSARSNPQLIPQLPTNSFFPTNGNLDQSLAALNLQAQTGPKPTVSLSQANIVNLNPNRLEIIARQLLGIPTSFSGPYEQISPLWWNSVHEQAIKDGQTAKLALNQAEKEWLDHFCSQEWTKLSQILGLNQAT